MLKIKRVYDEYEKSDGLRVLIDRLWPRGLSKEKAHVDIWLKDIAPSTELRKWFGHDPEKWNEFKKKYSKELNDNKEVVAKMVELVDENEVTLVYGAKDEEHNDAVVLKEYLDKR